MKTFILFTGSRCPACVTMKERLKKAGIEYNAVDVDEKENRNIAMSYRVKSLPTLLAIDDNDIPIYTLIGGERIGKN